MIPKYLKIMSYNIVKLNTQNEVNFFISSILFIHNHHQIPFIETVFG